MHADSPSSNVSSSSSSSSDNDAAQKVVAVSEIQTTTVVQEEKTQTSSGSGATKISFSVARQQTSRVVAGAGNKLDGGKRRDEEDEEEEEEQRAKKRAVLSLEDGVLIDAEPRAKREKKLLVIPVLQLSTQSQIARLRQLVEQDEATDSDRARLALLLESVGEQEEKKSGKTLLPASGLLQTGPTVAVADDTDPDYESMPVGEFGLAFLRGCGWKDAQSSIGKSNAQAVPLRVTAPRPKGLGLGATLPTAPPPTSTSSTKKTDAKNGEDEKDKQLGKHSYVKCLGGLNKGAMGQVTSMDEENASVFVELSWPPGSVGKTVRVSQMALELVPAREFAERVRREAATANGSGAAMSAERRRRKELRV